MTTKNKNNNDLVLYFIWVFGIVLTFASLFGILMVMAFGVATSLILSLLAVCVLVGILLFLFSSLAWFLGLRCHGIKSGGEMTIKNRNNNSFDAYRTLGFGFILILFSLFGLFLASYFGVAPTSPLVLILVFGVAYGSILILISILSVIITTVEYQPQNKKGMKK